jgi:hypothetical protein
MELEFTGDVFEWRGPAPFYYVAVPDEESDDIHAVSSRVTYGWGVIPVRVRIGDTAWETSLFPKDGRYLVPLKDAVRRAEQIDDGETVTVRLSIAT